MGALGGLSCMGEEGRGREARGRMRGSPPARCHARSLSCMRLSPVPPMVPACPTQWALPEHICCPGPAQRPGVQNGLLGAHGLPPEQRCGGCWCVPRTAFGGCWPCAPAAWCMFRIPLQCRGSRSIQPPPGSARPLPSPAQDITIVCKSVEEQKVQWQGIVKVGGGQCLVLTGLVTQRTHAQPPCPTSAVPQVPGRPRATPPPRAIAAHRSWPRAPASPSLSRSRRWTSTRR